MRKTILLATILALAFAGSALATQFPDYEELRARAQRLWTAKRPRTDAYLVLVPANSPLEPAAKLLAKHRKGEVLTFDARAPEKSLPDLIRKGARYVAVFVEATDMDVNLLRKFIVLSTLADEDPFCDFAFGFFTATNPEQVRAFVQRALAADRSGVEPYAAMLAIGSNISRKYAGSSFIRGMEGHSTYVKERDIAFARESLLELSSAGYVHIGGCADPEGVWLFDDKRNLDPTKHWPFDRTKVGQDPKGEMPRVKAEDFRKLTLDNAVVWTHACHIGSVSRMWVEGDIVSTFGACEMLEEYVIPPERSVGLAIIEAGASAYIAPLGPNHGGQATIEKAIASETGEPLGDIMRRAYHDVVMDTNGHPEQIGVFVTGKPKRWRPDGFVNFNSPHNRALYGDPMLRPFKGRLSPPTVTVEAKEKRAGIAVALRVESSGYLGRTLYGNRGREHPGRGRIYEAIPLEGDPAGVTVGETTAKTAEGAEFGISRSTALLERIDGRTWLHLQLVTDDPKALREEGATVRVRLRFHEEPGPGGHRGR